MPFCVLCSWTYQGKAVSWTQVGIPYILIPVGLTVAHFPLLLRPHVPCCSSLELWAKRSLVLSCSSWAFYPRNKPRQLWKSSLYFPVVEFSWCGFSVILLWLSAGELFCIISRVFLKFYFSHLRLSYIKLRKSCTFHLWWQKATLLMSSQISGELWGMKGACFLKFQFLLESRNAATSHILRFSLKWDYPLICLCHCKGRSRVHTISK